MLFYIDLGFPGAALLLVLLVGPVVVFVGRQKWRLAATRQAEVRRLALLAVQEAEMAEMEAMASYSATSADGAYSYSTYVAKELVARPECAVCSTLATGPQQGVPDARLSDIGPKQEWCFTCELESFLRNAKGNLLYPHVEFCLIYMTLEVSLPWTAGRCS